MDSLLSILQQVRPQLVITAPDGQKLYLDVSPDATGDSGTSLWPNGFTVSLATGNPPTDNPQVTTSPTSFFIDQSPTLLTAPGIGGVSWGAWLFLAVMVAILPLLGVYLWKK